MKEVIYFLGAGFSAPAGLPVISNFLFQAKNQFARDHERFKHFSRTFEYIDSLAKAKNFLSVDLFNIEEIFSIASTHALLGEDPEFLEKFIKDVISFHTPEFFADCDLADRKKVGQLLLSKQEVECLYLRFIGCAMGLYFSKDSGSIQKVKKPSTNYKFITLNYDLLIERAVDFLRKAGAHSPELKIAKLHGSVESAIVPPSWSKQIGENLKENWRRAAEWLRDANEIRFLGYSFPTTDVYVKHLLAAALIESSNLQQIDVITLDADNMTEGRFNQLFRFPRYRFVSFNLKEYLNNFSFASKPGDVVLPQLSHMSDPEYVHEWCLRHIPPALREIRTASG